MAKENEKKPLLNNKSSAKSDKSDKGTADSSSGRGSKSKKSKEPGASKITRKVCAFICCFVRYLVHCYCQHTTVASSLENIDGLACIPNLLVGGWIAHTPSCLATMHLRNLGFLELRSCCQFGWLSFQGWKTLITYIWLEWLLVIEIVFQLRDSQNEMTITMQLNYYVNVKVKPPNPVLSKFVWRHKIIDSVIDSICMI